MASCTIDAADTLEAYMAVCSQFKLGELPTESSNPATANLSSLCQNPDTVSEGLKVLQSVDVAALETIQAAVPQMEALAHDVAAVFAAGKKVVCEGCGATGRLSLSLEAFALGGMLEGDLKSRVKGFMAGGDVAFIRSIEQFEDRVPHGERQLHEIGFEDGDLLCAITEGGETPFVIAACEEALRVSPSRNPYFVYCNPDEVLCRVAERSKRVIENEKIQKINICVGPMAITGSTRMQATTVQLACVGLAIQYHTQPEKIGPTLQRLIDTIKAINYGVMAPLTSAEAKLYRDKEYFLYEANDFAVTTMTDTTERSPTFSLPAFESYAPGMEKFPSAQAFLTLPGTTDSASSWAALLGHAPRGLEWEDTKDKTGSASIAGYDFSDAIVGKRAAKEGADKTQHFVRVAIPASRDAINFTLGNRETKAVLVEVTIPVAKEIANDILLVNIVAKCLLNAHSTALMGINGRYEGNVMTYVRPTNNKLIDRAARYVKLLLERATDKPEGFQMPAYEAICERIFALRDQAGPNDPVVLMVVAEFKKKATASA